MDLGRQIWGADARAVERDATVFTVPTASVDGVLKEALASRRKEKEHLSSAQRPKPAAVRRLNAQSVAAIRARVEELRTRVSESGRRHLNAKQFDVVELVGKRLIRELEGAAADEPCDDDESLRWMVHGGPGTGKSHVLKTIRDELFVDVLGWTAGVEFQIVALQAVTAALIEGDTIHHGCGLVPAQFRRGRQADEFGQSQMDVAKKMLQWRWLFIDEIGMVSARLLAELDMQLRGKIRGVSRHKTNEQGRNQPSEALTSWRSATSISSSHRTEVSSARFLWTSFSVAGSSNPRPTSLTDRRWCGAGQRVASRASRSWWRRSGARTTRGCWSCRARPVKAV